MKMVFAGKVWDCSDLLYEFRDSGPPIDPLLVREVYVFCNQFNSSPPDGSLTRVWIRATLSDWFQLQISGMEDEDQYDDYSGLEYDDPEEDEDEDDFLEPVWGYEDEDDEEVSW